MGVPYAYAGSPELTGQIVAASGQVLRNWDAGTLARLFANNFVILNGDAAWTLCEMGLAALRALRACWLRQNDGGYAYEQVTNGKTYCGRKTHGPRPSSRAATRWM